MKFQPKTDEALEKEQQERMEQFLWKNGEYDAEVMYDMEKTSSKGNDMIEVKLIVYNGDKTQHIIDYLMDSMAFKMKHAFQAFGMEDRYNSGSYEDGDFANTACRVVLGTQKANGTYAAKNIIRDYVAGANIKAQPVKKSVDHLDDDIPF